MASLLDVDYSSESETDSGLEDQYLIAEDMALDGTTEETVVAFETVIEMDVELTKWGFRALTRILDLTMPDVLVREVSYEILMNSIH